MKWKICLDLFPLLFFFDLRSMGLLFEELVSDAADELQVALYAVIWSFIIIHYIFANSKVEVLNSFGWFINAKYVSYILGKEWGP